MNRVRLPLTAALVAVAVTVAAVLLTGSVRLTPPSGDTMVVDGFWAGTVLSDDDRRELAAVPVERGADPAPVDPTVDLTDPDAVARAYLAASRSLTVADTGRTHLRAAGYAVPGSPPATVGVVVLDPPPPGSVRTATVTALELVTADRGNQRRRYRAEIGTATGPPGGSVTVALVPGDVVVARRPDGRWLVAADSSPDLPAGED